MVQIQLKFSNAPRKMIENNNITGLGFQEKSRFSCQQEYYSEKHGKLDSSEKNLATPAVANVELWMKRNYKNKV